MTTACMSSPTISWLIMAADCTLTVHLSEGRMKRTSVLLFVSLVSTVLAPAARTAGGPDVTDTRMLTQPAVSQRHIAFIYAADLWVCDIDGRNVRRLTGDLGRESNPAFS